MPCTIDIWGSGDTAPPFLTSTIVGGEWLASRLGHFTPVEIAPGTHWLGGPESRSRRCGGEEILSILKIESGMSSL
jgi:hypothetical protein